MTTGVLPRGRSPRSFSAIRFVRSDIEAERDHLRVGDPIVRIADDERGDHRDATLSSLDVLLKITGNFYVVTEWTPLPADKARKEVNKRRRHFNMSKTGFVSQMGNDTTKTNPRDVLVDESKQADIENLGDCLRALGDGQSLGDFQLTFVLYGRSKIDLEQLGAEFTGLFTSADGNLFVETYNQRNAYFATVPGSFMRSASAGCHLAGHEDAPICRCRFTHHFPARRQTRISAPSIWLCSKPTKKRLRLLSQPLRHTGDVAPRIFAGMSRRWQMAGASPARFLGTGPISLSSLFKKSANFIGANEGWV